MRKPSWKRYLWIFSTVCFVGTILAYFMLEPIISMILFALLMISIVLEEVDF